MWPFWKPDIVQCSFNVLDQRIFKSGWLNRLKNFSNYQNYQNFQNIIKKINHKTDFSMNDVLNGKYKNRKNIKKFDNIDFSFGINVHITKFNIELSKLFSFFKKKSPTLKETKKFLSKNNYIFKNTNGLGINYFIFKKQIMRKLI
jgi:hypothetical protein|tara:strand:- start:351 stop:785 length:435 start_codon:yes stop_codon:yes gene_type:complete